MTTGIVKPVIFASFGVQASASLMIFEKAFATEGQRADETKVDSRHRQGFWTAPIDEPDKPQNGGCWTGIEGHCQVQDPRADVRG
jgi:hypothetical protein